MTLPERIKISRYAPDPGTYTDLIGHCRDGTQFMAFLIQFQGKLYALLHTFDSQGNHLGTQTSTHDSEAFEAAEKKLEEMLEVLSDPTFGDVEVKPFTVRVDGQDFGLLDDTEIDGGKTYLRLVLQPNDFLFTPPWDGSFDT